MAAMARKHSLHRSTSWSLGEKTMAFHEALELVKQAHMAEVDALQEENRRLYRELETETLDDVVLRERTAEATEGDERQVSKELEVSDAGSLCPVRSLSGRGQALLENRIIKSSGLDYTSAGRSFELQSSVTALGRRSDADNPYPSRDRRGTILTRSSAGSSTRNGCRSSVGTDYRVRSQWDQLPESAAVAWEHDLDEVALDEITQRLISLTKDPSAGLDEKTSGTRFTVTRMASTFGHVCFCRYGSWPLLNPGSPYRLSWDIACMALIGYDLISIPLMVFDPPDNIFTEGMAWFCLCFWTFDMVMSVSTGFYKDGQLVMSRKDIIANYLVGWFGVDCLVVVPDWILTILGSAMGRLGRILRVARAIRILRLLRLLKLKKLLNELYDKISNEYMFLVVELVKLLLLILLLNHIVACCWYGLGFLTRELGAERCWLADVGTTPVDEGDIGWKYSTALHWSITQFTPASMDIFATNTAERIFSVFILFWGLVVLSSVVGSVTASITAIRNMSGDQQKQFWMLRQYLKQREVSKTLTTRIVRYLDFRTAAKKNILPPGRILLLSQLSQQLRFQLTKEIKGRILIVHPFFFVLNMEMESIMDQACNSALKSIEFAEEDVVFVEGKEAIGMYFVSVGAFRYGSSHHILTPPAFLSEAALWTHWRHRGTLKAVGEVNEIFAVEYGSFAEIMGQHPKPWSYAKRYGQEFVFNINELLQSGRGNQLSDVVADRMATTSMHFRGSWRFT